MQQQAMFNTESHAVYRFCKSYLNQKHPGCKKRNGQELKKEKDVKSKWVAKACVVLLVMEIKF